MRNRNNAPLVALLLFAALQPLSAQTAPDLFASPTKAGGLAQAAMRIADQELPPEFRLVRSRLVSVDLSAIDPDNAERPQRLRLNFFSDSTFEATELIARQRANGEGFEWFGSLDDGMPAQAVLSVINGRVNGSLGTSQAHYQIRHIEGDLHVIQEILIDKPPADDALVPDPSRIRRTPLGPALAPELEPKADALPTVNGAGNTVLDVLVCYTTLTRQSRGGSQAVRDLIQLTLSETNASFINSEIAVEFNLVGMVEIDGDGGSSIPEQPSSAFIEDITFNRTDIHALRDYYGADLVSVWVNNTNGGVVGVGWVFQGGDFTDFPYSVVSYPYAQGPSYTFAHEAGHNMGGAHNRENAGVEGRYDYSYGYRKNNAEPKFYTIMSYSSGCSGCAAVNHWSNPLVDITRNGATAPSGVAAGVSNSADNALTLSNTGPVQAAYRAPASPPANNAPQAASQLVEVDRNSSVAITLFGFDPDSDPLGFSIQAQPTNGGVAGSGSARTYTPQLDYVGPDSFEYHVHDNRGGFAAATVSIVVKPESGGPGITPPLAEGVNVAGATDQWQTIALTKTYVSPVIVCTPEYAQNSPPLTTRLRNVGASSFQLRLGRFDASTAAVMPTPARCLIVEEGVYTTAANGVALEAVKFNSTVTDHDGSWAGQSRSYANSYSGPVVVGQVMSTNDANPSVFWARGPNNSTAPTASTLFVGKTVNEDPNIARANETIGYIVINAGVASAGALTIEAGVKVGIAGLTSAPPYLINLTTTPSGAVLSSATMVGYNGGWPLLYAPDAVSGQQLRAALDEDQLLDSERTHIAERVAYVAWTNPSGANQDPTADPRTLTTAYETALPITLTGSDPDLDGLTFAIDVQPANGVLSGLAPNVTYTPNALFSGPDSFTFSVNDGRGGVDQAVVSITVGAPNQGPTANPQSLSTAYQTALPIVLTGSDPDLDALTFAIDIQPTNGVLSGVAPNVTYTPNAPYSGPDSFTFSVDDSRGGVDQAVVSITVGLPPPTASPAAEGITIAGVTDLWQTVALTNTYVSPVIVCTPEYSQNSPPLTTRLRNVGASSFELRLGRFDALTAAVSPTLARCLVVEEGVYTSGASGVMLEAVKFNSTVTDHDGSWAGHSRSYGNSYESPVVVGQVMSTNDAKPSVFWARGPNVSTAPTASTLFVGKTVNEDPTTARANETVGYIVLEAGVAAVGSLTVEAGVKVGVSGLADSPPYLVNLTTTPSGAVLSSATMNGFNGGWPLFHGPNAVSGQQLRTAMDEDQLFDSERNHIAERVAYAAWTNPASANHDPTANPQTLTTAYGTGLPITLTGSDPDLDGLTIAIEAPPANGVLSGVAPNVTYTPDALYSGPDSFTFSVDDGKGGVDQAMVSITVADAVNQTPTADARTLTTAHETALPIVLTGSDPDLDSLIFSIAIQPTNGILSGAAPNVVYTPNALYSGPDSFAFSVDDGNGGVDQAVVSITVEAAPPVGGLLVEGINLPAVTEQWQTIALTNIYVSPVIVCTPEYGAGSAPLTVRLRNVGSTSFDLRMGRFDKSTDAVTPTPARCFVVEEGVYTAAAHGVTLEAVKFNSTVTDNSTSWFGEARTYGNAYANPAVVGQVMSTNDARPVSFWSRGPDVSTPPTATTLFVGKTANEDPITARANETIGYIVMESGVATVGSVTLEAGVGGGVEGYGTAPPYTLSLTTTPSGAVLSGATMFGYNGGWPILYGPGAVVGSQLRVAFDEDQLLERERDHLAENVAYLAWTNPASANLAPTADSQFNFAVAATPLPIVLTGKDPDLEVLTFGVAVPPTYGTLSGVAPNLTYTANSGYEGPDSFTFWVKDTHGATAQATASFVVLLTPNNKPAAESQKLVADYQATVSFSVSALDLDNNYLNFTIVDQGTHGTLTGALPNLTYTPDAGFSGLDSVVFRVDDGFGGSDTGTIWIAVRRPLNRQQIVISTAEQLHHAFRDAAPGEEYLLAPGVYAQPGSAVFSTLNSGLLATADAPIVFRAQNPANPPTIATLLLLQSPQHVEFHDIRFVNPPNNVHNINIYSMDGVAATDVTFAGCHFEGTQDAKARANIKGTRMDNLVVRNTTFHGWGDSAIATVGLWNGIVENSKFIGKSTHNQRTALQLKGDTRDVVVRNNYFEDAGARVVQAGGATEAQFFRAPAEYEASRIEIHGNRIVGGDACFTLSTQVDSSFHHNTCYLPKVWIGRLLQESNQMLKSRNGRIEHNLFVYNRFINGEFTNVGGGILLDTFTLNHNAFYQTDGDLWYFPRLPLTDPNIVDQVDPELVDAGTERMRIGSTNPLFIGIGADAVNPVP